MGERVAEFIGVYDAKGSLRGELAYLLGKVAGRRHCALCDITHGTLRRRPEFDRAAASLGPPFTLVHLDQMGHDVATAVGGAAPCVLGRTDDGLVVLADGPELSSCAGDPDRLVDLLRDNAATLGLRFEPR